MLLEPPVEEESATRHDFFLYYGTLTVGARCSSLLALGMA